MLTRRLFSKLAAAPPAALATAALGTSAVALGSALSMPRPEPCGQQTQGAPDVDLANLRPGELSLAPPRPLLMLFDPARVDVADLQNAWLASPGWPIEVSFLPALGMDLPLQIFDLSGAPAGLDGQLEAIVARVAGRVTDEALAAERERCAQVALRYNAPFCNPPCYACDIARAIAAHIRALTPATAETQAEDLALMRLAADIARRNGECTLRVYRAHDGGLQMQMHSYGA